MKGQNSLQTQIARRGDGLSPTDLSLLATPLDFLCADHLRERQVCSVIDWLALSASFDPSAARTVLRFVNEELNIHMRDEAEDLFLCLPAAAPQKTASPARSPGSALIWTKQQASCPDFGRPLPAAWIPGPA